MNSCRPKVDLWGIPQISTNTLLFFFYESEKPLIWKTYLSHETKKKLSALLICDTNYKITKTAELFQATN